MFFKETSEIDLGETSIDNIFIDIFMPMANGTYVKIYLLAYRYALNPSFNEDISNISLAKNLNIPLSDVLSAWDFWEEKSIIKKHKQNDSEDWDYSVEFLSLKKLYFESIVGLKSAPKSKTTPDELIESNSNLNTQKMFNDICKIISRQLVPKEKMDILDIMNKYNLSPEMIKYAYSYSNEKKGIKNVKYIEGIIRNWNDLDIYTIEDLEQHMIKKSERFSIYKLIFNELGFRREATKAEQDTMDSWIDSFNFDKDMILKACSKSINVSNPSITFINGILKRWYEKGFKVVDDIVETPKKTNPRQQSKENKYVNRFHNFEQRTSNYTAEELEKMILENQERRLRQGDDD